MVFLQVSQHWWAKRTEIVSHPLLHLHTTVSGTSLPFYLFCSLPWTEGHRRRNHLLSRSDQIDLLFYWSQVHKVISIFQFSGVTWDIQEHQDSVGMPRDNSGYQGKGRNAFPKGQQPFTVGQDRKWKLNWWIKVCEKMVLHSSFMW